MDKVAESNWIFASWWGQPIFSKLVNSVDFGLFFITHSHQSPHAIFWTIFALGHKGHVQDNGAVPSCIHTSARKIQREGVRL